MNSSVWSLPADEVLCEDSSELFPRGGPLGQGQTGEILLAGHFDPAMISSLLSAKEAGKLAGLTGPPGVPIHHLAKGFVERGLKVSVLGGLRNASPCCVKGEAIAVTIYQTRSTRAFTLTGFRRERAAILKHLNQTSPAIVHAHWTMEAARAVADWKGPRILTVHDAAYEYARLGWRWHPGAMAYKARWLLNTRAVLRKFDHIIAVSPFVEAYLRLTHGFQGEIRTIPNAIPPLPRDLKPIDSFPRTSRLTFATYGGPDPLKNVGKAISAFRCLQKSLPQSRLLVFGEGWRHSEMRDRTPAIEFRGSVRHDAFLRSLASEVDIWVHPAKIETHSITICEAIQAGCAVIAGRSSGAVPWTLDYGSAGVLVDIHNSEEIAQAMLALARNRERALASVAYGRKMILERFSPDRVLDAHLRYYNDVINEWKCRTRN